MWRLMLVFVGALVALPSAAADVSASVAISQPGFYGQINIGDFPRPTVIYAEPVWVQRPRKVVYVEPIYLRVPPGHEKHWSKNCGKYNACGRPVYFVREDWYQTVYVPRHKSQDYYARGEDHDDDRGNGKSNGKGKGGH